MPRLDPTLCVESFGTISFEQTSAAAGRKIDLLSLDADRLLVPHGGWHVPADNLAAVERLSQEYRSSGYDGGSEVMFAINSNAGSPGDQRRISFIAAQIAEASASPVPAVTSLETGHRKPHPAPYKAVSEQSGVPLGQICHVDDQWGKGILGAILAGCGASILASPFGPATDEHPGTRFVQRHVETALRPFFGLPFKVTEFGDDASASERYRTAERLSAGVALGLGISSIALLRNRKSLAGAALAAASAGLSGHAVSMSRTAERLGREESDNS